MDKYLNLARELKKTMEHEDDSDTNCNWCTWNNPQRIDKWIGRLRNKKTSTDHPDYCIIKISKDTEKSHGDLKRLAVAQIPVENHQLTKMEKTLKSKE